MKNNIEEQQSEALTNMNQNIAAITRMFGHLYLIILWSFTIDIIFDIIIINRVFEVLS